MSIATDYILQMRELVGDTEEDYEYLEDSMYEYFYQENNYNVKLGAIAALDSIITYAALNPVEADTRLLERRLKGLKASLSDDATLTPRIPMIIKSDRRGFKDFNNIFNRNGGYE